MRDIMKSINKLLNFDLNEIVEIQKKSLEVSEINNKLFTNMLKKARFSQFRDNILLFIIALNCCFSLLSLIK